MDRREFLTSAGAVAAVSAMMSAGAEVAPEKKYRPFLWRDMTCAEFAEAVKATKGVCVVPIGCLEKHGNHLPLATDSIVAHEVCVRAASLEPVIVFPFCPFGRVVEVLWCGEDRPGYANFLSRMNQRHRGRLISCGVNCAPLE